MVLLSEAGHLEQLIEVLGGKDDVLVPAVSGRATGAAVRQISVVGPLISGEPNDRPD